MYATRPGVGDLPVNNVGDSGGQVGGDAGNVGGDVNPYHQAWAQAADERLSLVYSWGVANIIMGSDVVDLYDFQQNQKEFPVDFFKKDLRTGIQRLFNCVVCGVTLAEEGLVRAHCVSRDHSRLVEESKRMEKRNMRGGEKNKDTRKLREVLEGVEEPCIGLEQITEWWPGLGREVEPPIYSCQLCGDWAGWGGDMARHVVGERHRREQLVNRYPVLEGMIKDMDRVELAERAREEEEKHQRRYDVIQSMVDCEKYDELVMRCEGTWGPVGRGGFSQRGHFDNGENNPRNWESGPGYGRGTFGNRGRGRGDGLLIPPGPPPNLQYSEAMGVGQVNQYPDQRGWTSNNEGYFQGHQRNIGPRGNGSFQRGGQYRGQRGQFGYPNAIQNQPHAIGNRGQFNQGFHGGGRGNFGSNDNWGRGGRGTRGQNFGQAHMRGTHNTRGQSWGPNTNDQFSSHEFKEEFGGQMNRGQYNGHRGQYSYPNHDNVRGRGGYGGQHSSLNQGNQWGESIGLDPGPLMKDNIPGSSAGNIDNQMMEPPPHINVEKREEQEGSWRTEGETENKYEMPSSRSMEPQGGSGRLQSQESFGRGRGIEMFGRGGGRGRGRGRDDGFAGGFTRGGSTERPRPRGFGRQRGFGRAGAMSNLGLGFGRGASSAPGFGRGSAKAGTSPGRGSRTLQEDEDLPEACYAVSAEQEDADDKEKTKKKADEDKEKKRDRSYTPEYYPEDDYYDDYYDNYDDYGYGYDRYDYDHDEYRDMSYHYNQRYYGPEEDYRGLHGVRKVGQFGREYALSRGARPDSRYYGPEEGWKGRKRAAGQADDAPYEGPTIFDKVFRTKKKGDDDSGGRGERERDQVMEREWRRYKERTEARIRREKEKLERYERRMKEFQGGEEEASTSARDGGKRRKRQRRSLDNSPPRAYTNRPAYTSSESEREDSLPPPPPPPLDSPPSSPAPTPTPPPGSKLCPVLSPTTADSDIAQAKFDPY